MRILAKARRGITLLEAVAIRFPCAEIERATGAELQKCPDAALWVPEITVQGHLGDARFTPARRRGCTRDGTRFAAERHVMAEAVRAQIGVTGDDADAELARRKVIDNPGLCRRVAQARLAETSRMNN